MLIKSNNLNCVIIVVVVLLLLQVYRIDSLNTGYKDNQIISVENIHLLKCSYLLNALNYMQIARIEIHHTNFILINACYPVSQYLGVLKKMMKTLFGFKGIEIGSLWLLNMYLGIVSHHVHKLKELKKMGCSVEYEQTYLENTHDYVIVELESEVSTMKCNKENNKCLIIQKNAIKQLENQPLNVIRNIMTRVTEIMDRFILKNTDLSIKNYEMFSKNNILIKSIGHNAHRTIYLMNEYNVQVNWGENDKGTMQILQKKYEKTHNLNWKDNNLKDIKIYYNSVFSFFKIIMLRLTWKHLLYVNKQQNESIKIELINKWFEILDEFVKFFRLKDDDYVCKIKKSINVNHDAVIELLKSYLNDLCCDLKCNAINEMKLNGEEFPTKESTIIHNESDVETVKYYSLGAAKKFIITTKNLFTDNDFNVVKSFIDYAEKNQFFFQAVKIVDYLFS